VGAADVPVDATHPVSTALAIMIAKMMERENLVFMAWPS
jgi:hypothetical protein